MKTILTTAGLIIEQFGNLLMDEFFWIVILILIMIYRRNSVMETRMLGRSYPLIHKVFSSVLVGLAGGLLGSLLVIILGISIADYTRTGGGSLTESITYIWLLAVILALINPRYLCFSYAGGIIALSNLLLGFPSVNVPGLMALVGVLHLIESFLIWLDGYTYSVPMFIRRKDGRTVGGYFMNKIWPIPLVAFAVIFGAEGGRASLAGIIDMSSWWPIIKHSAAGGVKDLIYVPLVVPVVLGYGDMAVTGLPDRKCGSSAIKLAVYSILLVILSILASKLRIFAYVAALFAPLAHEALICYGAKEEEEGEPYFANKDTGIKVLYVQKDSIASKMRIEAGDTLQMLNGIALNNEKQLAELLSSYPSNIWMDIRKAGGKSITVEHSDYRRGIGSLGALIVPRNAEFYYELDSGGSLIKRLTDRFRGKYKKDIDI